MVVCTANICRSPAAESILKKILQNTHAQIDSSGTDAQNNYPADSAMVNYMKRRGYDDLSSHRSKILMPSHLLKYDLILCMENRHLQIAESMQINARGKIKLLGHWSDNSEVGDPVGLSEKHYENAINQMEFMAQQWYEKILLLGLLGRD